MYLTLILIGKHFSQNSRTHHIDHPETPKRIGVLRGDTDLLSRLRHPSLSNEQYTHCVAFLVVCDIAGVIDFDNSIVGRIDICESLVRGIGFIQPPNIT